MSDLTDVPEERFSSAAHQRWLAERKTQDPLNPQPIILVDQDEVENIKVAANNLIDYCEAHNWGTMPEPFASINPLLKLLGREPYKG